MSSNDVELHVSRRQLLGGAVGVATAASLPGVAAAADASPATGNPAANRDLTVMADDRYATVALQGDYTNVTAIQSRTKSVDVRNLKKSMRENLDYVLRLIDAAQSMPEEWGNVRRWGAKQDLICMHEFPLQGFQPWNRKEMQQVAIDLPGPETEAIGARARKYGCYIAFGCYAKDKDWPGHVINMSVIVAPDGDIASKQWKYRNELGFGATYGWGPIGLISTTIYDVLDRYVEMYGWDAMVPVARTDIGNIAMTSAGDEPLLDAAIAMKGAEILILSVTGGSNRVRASATARANRIYTVGVCNSVSFDNLGFSEAAGARDEGTVICDPRGSVIAQTHNHHDDFAVARLPMANYRNTRRPPQIPIELVLPVFQKYKPKFKPNAFADYLPDTFMDAGEFVEKRMGWR